MNKKFMQFTAPHVKEALDKLNNFGYYTHKGHRYATSWYMGVEDDYPRDTYWIYCEEEEKWMYAETLIDLYILLEGKGIFDGVPLRIEDRQKLREYRNKGL